MLQNICQLFSPQAVNIMKFTAIPLVHGAYNYCSTRNADTFCDACTLADITQSHDWPKPWNKLIMEISTSRKCRVSKPAKSQIHHRLMLKSSYNWQMEMLCWNVSLLSSTAWKCLVSTSHKRHVASTTLPHPFRELRARKSPENGTEDVSMPLSSWWCSGWMQEDCSLCSTRQISSGLYCFWSWPWSLANCSLHSSRLPVSSPVTPETLIECSVAQHCQSPMLVDTVAWQSSTPLFAGFSWWYKCRSYFHGLPCTICHWISQWLRSACMFSCLITWLWLQT